MTTRVDRVVFSGGKIGPGQFISFPVSILVPKGSAGTKLTFKALQTYSNGEVVRSMVPSADRASKKSSGQSRRRFSITPPVRTRPGEGSAGR